ncbi:2-isopropylmalate synthase [Neptuniibacter caesariensis]|uniref:2-isopropylmalate synthase n=1 Tax=Neptuniibacter caesariensis TaxID=207954 RepID=A0A7U8C6Y1_NEPCE|nr:2-isopropylmalate synthase [Neptuniibacter caesariensis]EAR61009.1 probable 2-isopropylmalate synthase [Neptuniibacter caesariensis]
MFDHRKYRRFETVRLKDRTWPDNEINKAPDWCSVDLRDGNQALINPMSVEQKTRMFTLLVKLGFKEIEVGFPSASKPDYDFVRKLVDENLIPDDVSIQVLTQAREELIKKTFDALGGVKKANVHVYNSTSVVQREQVFGMDKDEIKGIAVQGAKWVRDYAKQHPDTQWEFQYSPESYTGTEMDFAVEVCDAVIAEWQPENGQKVVINLPSTVEMSTPNVFADQVEYFCRKLKQRDQVRISLHTHNDRGCAVAAAELGVMAGADRVEGTLMGNGERTGNMDIVTMGMNLYSQGIDPELDFSDIKEIIEVVESCNEIPVSVRHPWAGELVYTAFSGSHQDAIRKSVNYHKEHNQEHWDVAYLPIDPRDISREYEAVVRINSQSGKGGVALVLERDYGIELPKWMHVPLSKVVQSAAEQQGVEVSPEVIYTLYQKHFVEVADAWTMTRYDLHTDEQQVSARFQIGDAEFSGQGAGALEALKDALSNHYQCQFEVTQFDEHAIGSGTDAKAQATVAVEVDGATEYAVAISEDTSSAALQAMLTAFGRHAVAEQRISA